MRSLRGRLTLGVGVIIAVVLIVSGVVISGDAERNSRRELDDRLERTAQLFLTSALDVINNSSPRDADQLAGVLDATDSSLRVVVGDSAPLFEAGTREIEGPVGSPGLRTVARAGIERYRVLVKPVKGAGLGALARLEVASSLNPLERRQASLDRRLVRIGLGALLLVVLATFFTSVRVLGPLRRLRRAARRVADEEDLSVRVSESDGPGEMRELASSINEMLERLSTAAAGRERALAATRRFALDAGHEIRTPLTTVQATLSTLSRHPDIDPAQRAGLLEDALGEQRRLVDLLDGLQAYARGEASLVEHEPVDLADVVAAAVADVRHGYPGTTIEADVPDAAVTVTGWEAGLRLLATNLIGNAARHGPEGQTVRVQLTGHPQPRLTVDDQGAGIPPPDRDRIFTPFERLEGAAGRDGSGLGLALVAQQVREHHAAVSVDDAPGGGARFVVRFP